IYVSWILHQVSRPGRRRQCPGKTSADAAALPDRRRGRIVVWRNRGGIDIRLRRCRDRRYCRRTPRHRKDPKMNLFPTNWADVPLASMSLLGPLALFALVSSITSGPNNVMLASSGLNFGVR